MSIPVLTQTYDEMRRLAIAGSVVAPGDFRLKRLVPQLEQLGQKAPVFAKVAEAVNRLLAGNEKSSAAALLELTSLVNAILYTQGETGLDGELAPIKTIEIAQPRTQTSARMLKPLQDALTTTGAGRLEVIRDGHERGMFHDFRLIAPALAALDDSYAEIADFVLQKILPHYGAAILPELQATFQPKGRGGHVRRLLLMHQLDPAAARPLVRRSLDEGSQEVRIAAISCLGDSPDDLPFLLEQAKAKAKDVRTAALRALGSSGADDAAKVLCNAIDSADLTLAVEPIRASRNPAVTSVLLEAAEKLCDAITSTSWLGRLDKSKLGKQNERICLVLECLRGRDDKKTEKLLLKLFEHVEQLAKVKGEPSGTDVVERLVSVMTSGSKIVQAALVDAHESLPADSLGQGFLAACRSRKPAEVFKLFSPYFTAKINEKKKMSDPAFAKREAIADLLKQARGPWGYGTFETDSGVVDIAGNLDPQWLDLAVSLGRIDLVHVLSVPGHAKANALLARLFNESCRAGNDSESFAALNTMVRVRHPEATDAAIELIKLSAKSKTAYRYYWIGHIIPKLPRDEAVPKLEALLPTLPEKMIDQLLDSVAELKNRVDPAAT
jgi:HEAT repeat protein